MKSNRTSGTRGQTYHAGEFSRRMEGVARSHAREARERDRKWDAARSLVFMRVALILRKKPDCFAVLVRGCLRFMDA